MGKNQDLWTINHFSAIELTGSKTVTNNYSAITSKLYIADILSKIISLEPGGNYRIKLLIRLFFCTKAIRQEKKRAGLNLNVDDLCDIATPKMTDISFKKKAPSGMGTFCHLPS